MDEQLNTIQEEVQVANEEKSFGPMIGILIIVALLVFGGLYFWGASLQDNGASAAGTSPTGSSFEVIDTTIEEFTMTDEEFSALIGDSSIADDTAEAALDTTLDDLNDLDSLDAELEALELEL